MAGSASFCLYMQVHPVDDITFLSPIPSTYLHPKPHSIYCPFTPHIRLNLEIYQSSDSTMLSIAASIGTFLSSIGFSTDFVSSLMENLDSHDIIYRAVQLATVGILADSVRHAAPIIASFLSNSMSSSVIFS